MMAATVTDEPPPLATRKYPPNRMMREPGAVVCRVSRSFLRFGNMELFALRKEFDLLAQLADYVCFREFPHLLAVTRERPDLGTNQTAEQTLGTALSEQLPRGPPQRYVSLFREVAQKSAFLMSEWLRVGYVQGNMNSDNCLLGGRTMDYGPFAFMEAFHPYYQPFTSDAAGNFAFNRQPAAMALNLEVLGA